MVHHRHDFDNQPRSDQGERRPSNLIFVLGSIGCIEAIYHLNEKFDIGAAYEFLWAGSMSVDQGTAGSLRGRVAGSHEDSWFSFASLNVNWKF